MNKLKENTYKLALAKFGEMAQINMVFEESAELQKELCKYLRGEKNENKIAEEIADVRIMLEQMELHFDIEKEIKEIMIEKVNRLKLRIVGMDV